MAPRLSDVWLRLFQLAEAFEASGSSHDARVQAIKEQWLTMPPELRQQSLDRLDRFSRLISEVTAACQEETE